MDSQAPPKAQEMDGAASPTPHVEADPDRQVCIWDRSRQDRWVFEMGGGWVVMQGTSFASFARTRTDLPPAMHVGLGGGFVTDSQGRMLSWNSTPPTAPRTLLPIGHQDGCRGHAPVWTNGIHR